MAPSAVAAETYGFHEAANIFPLDEGHLDGLAEDIKEHGLLVPIELFEDKILDGRRRYLACRQAKIEPEFCDVSPADPIAYVKTLNLHRRHLTVSQAAMCAARAIELYQKRAKERQKLSKGRGQKGPVNCPDLNASDSRDEAGEEFGVSGKTVDRAGGILATKSAKLINAVDEGKVTVYQGHRISKEPEHLQGPLLEAAIAQPPSTSPKSQPKRKEQIVPGKKRGMGVIRANEAIDCLAKIPRNDALRKRGFQIVTDWIKSNR